MLLDDEKPRVLPGFTHIQTWRVACHDAETGITTPFCIFGYRHDATGGLVIGMHERYRHLYQKMQMRLHGGKAEPAQ